MEVVTHVLAAEDDEIEAIGESTCPLDQWSGIETPGLDTVKIAILHCLLTGDSLQAALDVYEPVYVTSETIVLRISDDSLEKLASFGEEALLSVAGELAATEAFEKEDWHVDDVRALLTDLAELAQLAESQGQALFVWMFLTQR